MSGDLESSVRRLVARAEIHDVLMTYFRGVDRLDLDLVRSCYHPDATDTHGSFSGSVDEFIDWVGGLLGRYDSTFHFAGNVLIEFVDESTAQVETYAIAHHRKAGGRPQENLITGFRFIDRFERHGEGDWLIAERIATTEWVRVDDEAGWHRFPDHFLSGRRDGSDPIYRSAGGA